MRSVIRARLGELVTYLTLIGGLLVLIGGGELHRPDRRGAPGTSSPATCSR